MSDDGELALEQIVLKNASVVYPGGAIGVNNASLEIRRGQSLVILGQSGAGKSTLLRLAAGIQMATAGGVRWEDREGRQIREIWPQVSVVFQKFFLWPHISVWKNLTLPYAATKSPTPPEVDELIEALGLQRFLHRYSYELSVGQQQRVALARAIATRPNFLLVDEISSALDPETTFDVYSMLRALQGDGMAVVAITHLPGLAINYFDDYLFVHHGEVIDSGKTVDLGHASDVRVRRYLDIASFHES